MYQSWNRLLQWTRAMVVLIVIAFVGACGGSNSSGDDDGSSTDGGTTDGSNTDGGTTDGSNNDGDTDEDTDGGTTDGGTTDGTVGGSSDLNITAYNNRIDMTPLQNVAVSIYGDDDRTIIQT